MSLGRATWSQPYLGQLPPKPSDYMSQPTRSRRGLASVLIPQMLGGGGSREVAKRLVMALPESTWTENAPLLTFARCRIIPRFAPLPDLGIDRPKSRRAQLGVA